MEGKEIIENMTKDEAKLAPRSSAVNVGSLRIQLKYPTAGGAGDSSALDSWAKRELADKSLICEAFNVANKTGLTPSQLHAELEVTDKLLQERQRVLDAIPDCSSHGKCVPHAIDWITDIQSELEKAKELLKRCKTEIDSIDWCNELSSEISDFLEGSGNKTK